MFYDESWKPICFGLKGQGHETQNTAGVGLCTLVSAGFLLVSMLFVWGRERDVFFGPHVGSGRREVEPAQAHSATGPDANGIQVCLVSIPNTLVAWLSA